MVTFSHKFLAISLILIISLVAACGSESDSSDEEMNPTAEPTAVVTAEVTAQQTEEVAVTEEVAETPEPGVVTDAEVDIPNLSEDGQYLITVIDAFDSYDAGDVPGLEADEKWVLVRLTINNQDALPFSVTSAALKAVDTTGNTYTAEAPNDATQPTILNTEIPTGEPLTGFALYALPQDAQIDNIEWCLDEDCQETLIAPVLTIES